MTDTGQGMIGQQIENYRILSKLGEGAMGVVYKAVDVNLERVVALKLMNAGLSHHPDLEARFRSEARTQATLNHQNIATLYSFLTWEGKAVMVMEFVDGKTLQQMVVERGALPPVTALALCKQALYGVGAAHRQGIVHRDLKPANLMLSNEGVIKVMDFGIAKIKGGAGLKGTSMAIGTYDYMAPEQALNKQVDGRSDIYSMGITLYEMLTGDVPFKGDSELAVQMAHLNERPRDPRASNPAVPEAVANVVLRALEKNPEDRFATTDDFIRALPRLSDASGQTPKQPLPERGTVIDTGGFGGTQVIAAPAGPLSRPPVASTQVSVAPSPPLVMPAVAPVPVVPPVKPQKKSNAGALLVGVVGVVIVVALVAGWFVFKPKKDKDAGTSNSNDAKVTQQTPSTGATTGVGTTPAPGTHSVTNPNANKTNRNPPADPNLSKVVKPQQDPQVQPPIVQPPVTPPLDGLVGKWSGSYKDSSANETSIVVVNIRSETDDGRLAGDATFTLQPSQETTTCALLGSRYTPASRELLLSYTSCKGPKRVYMNLSTTFEGVDSDTSVVRGGTVRNQSSVTVGLVKSKF